MIAWLRASLSWVGRQIRLKFGVFYAPRGTSDASFAFGECSALSAIQRIDVLQDRTYAILKVEETPFIIINNRITTIHFDVSI